MKYGRIYCKCHECDGSEGDFMAGDQQKIVEDTLLSLGETAVLEEFLKGPFSINIFTLPFSISRNKRAF